MLRVDGLRRLTKLVFACDCWDSSTVPPIEVFKFAGQMFVAPIGMSSHDAVLSFFACGARLHRSVFLTSFWVASF